MKSCGQPPLCPSTMTMTSTPPRLAHLHRTIMSIRQWWLRSYHLHPNQNHYTKWHNCPVLGMSKWRMVNVDVASLFSLVNFHTINCTRLCHHQHCVTIQWDSLSRSSTTRITSSCIDRWTGSLSMLTRWTPQQHGDVCSKRFVIKRARFDQDNVAFVFVWTKEKVSLSLSGPIVTIHGKCYSGLEDDPK